jgi:hypothetical protein
MRRQARKLAHVMRHLFAAKHLVDPVFTILNRRQDQSIGQGWGFAVMARFRPLRAILAILVLATLIIAARTQGRPAAKEARPLVKVGEVSEGKGEEAEPAEKERLKALVLANTDRGREAIEERVNTWYRAFKRQLTVARMEEFEKLKIPKRSLYALRMSTRPGIIGYTDSGRAADLIGVITKVAAPAELFLTYQPCPFSSGLG